MKTLDNIASSVKTVGLVLGVAATASMYTTAYAHEAPENIAMPTLEGKAVEYERSENGRIISMDHYTGEEDSKHNTGRTFYLNCTGNPKAPISGKPWGLLLNVSSEEGTTVFYYDRDRDGDASRHPEWWNPPPGHSLEADAPKCPENK